MNLDGEDYAALFAALPTPYVVVTPAITVAGANDAFLGTVGRTLADLVGRPVFEAFPPTDDALDDQGRTYIKVALERIRDTGVAEIMPMQRYDIADLVGEPMTHYWSLIGVPIRDEAGAVRLIALRAEDVTDFMQERARGRLAEEQSGEWQRRVQEVEADLFARAQDLALAVSAREQAAQRLTSLAEVALQLTSVDDLEALEEVVVGRGLRVLGADGGAVTSLEDDGSWRVTVNTALGAHVQLRYGHLPFDSPLPACWTARTGERLLLPDRASGLAFYDGMAEVYADTRRGAWAFLPLRVRGEHLGSLAVSWTETRVLSPDELEVLDGFAAQCAQALDRIRTSDAQRAATHQVERMSEALQVSLLTSPPAPRELDIAVRYLPAMQQAQVGGDWYDAFVDTAGATLVCVGDVAGHDRSAAAAMGQLRNLLRGLAVDSGDTPGVLLSRLDRALSTLELDVLATALLARVEPDNRLLRWSNAGHVPALLCSPDLTVTVLTEEADLLLGLDPSTQRSEHSIALAPGSTLVLCTDGLVERRDEHLDAGIERLTQALCAISGSHAEDVADALLAAMLDSEPEDDVAILVLRVL